MQIALTNPKTFAVEIKKSEDKGYSIDMQVIKVELGGHTKNHTSKIRVLMDFGEHGRELISSELGLRLLELLADSNATRTFLGGGQRGEEMVKRLREDYVLVILPMENTRGRELVESGKLCERKNGRGVDTNRNWEVDWGKKERDYDPAEEYPGTAPFSEPEVKIIHELTRGLQPHVWLNVHSGMEALFTPWDHKAEVPTSAQPALGILQQLQKEVFDGRPECVVGSGGKSVGYLAHGTATDYMFEKMRVPLPFTWEIFGDMNADYHDCFRMFNPVSKQQYEDTIALWLRAIFRLLELVPTHPKVAADLAAAKAAGTGQWQTGSGTGSKASPPAAAKPTEQRPGQQQQQQQTGQQKEAVSQQQQKPEGAKQEVVGQQQQRQQQAGSPPAVFVVEVQEPGGRGGFVGAWALLLGLGGLVVVGLLLARFVSSNNEGARKAAAGQAGGQV